MLDRYYQDFKQVLQADLDLLLNEPDPTQRSNKQIKDFLEMLADCETKIKELESNDADKYWDQLSEKAKSKILEIIKKDLGHE